MPLIIAVSLFKGGVGKTTTAVALGEAAASVAGPATVIDVDPMGSALRWSSLAEESGRPLAATYVGLPTADIARRLGSVTGGANVVVIDSPPPGAMAAARAVVAASHLVLMPAPARLGDLDRVPATLAAAAEYGRPVYAVLTMVRRTSADLAARQALDAWGVPVLKAHLPLRVAVANNYGARPSGVLADFGHDVLTEITERVDL
jgi:chromosome partitioning protein